MGQAKALTASAGPEGLTTLNYGGVNMLSDGSFRVTGAFLRAPDGKVVAADLTAGKRSADPKAGKVTWTYPWGSVGITYVPSGDRLNMDVSVSVADGTSALAAIYVQPAVLKFPSTPKFINDSFMFYTSTTMGHNVGAPGIVAAESGTDIVAACNEQMDRPLAFGFAPPTDAAKTVYPLLAYTGRHPMAKEKFPFIDRPVYPGGRDRFRLSLRFAPQGTAVVNLADDLFKRYGATYPYQLKWKDCRPIGRLFISSAHQSLAENYPKNPPGWLNRADIDVTTDEGRAKFKESVMAWVDNAVNICTAMKAQGMILWDPEGQENPHATSYIGDPRSLPSEMEPIIDDVFKKFSSAGLCTGICIRPQRAVRPIYGTAVSQMAFVDTRDRLNNLAAKIDYAKKRWGCTLFYMDSNVDWYEDPYRIPGAEGYSATVDDDLLRQLNERFPDCLIMPEWETLRSYAYSAPYSDVVYNKLTGPPAEVLAAYPSAFFANSMAQPQVEEKQSELAQSVKRGDILMFSGWWPSPENKFVKQMYDEAGLGAK